MSKHETTEPMKPGKREDTLWPCAYLTHSECPGVEHHGVHCTACHELYLGYVQLCPKHANAIPPGPDCGHSPCAQHFIDTGDNECLRSPSTDALYAIESEVAAQVVARPCDPGCPGWFENNETGKIERCDDCQRFGDDDEAENYVVRRLTALRKAFGLDTTREPTWRCKDCAGTRLHTTAWIDAVTGEPTNDEPPLEVFYCLYCEGEVEVEGV